MLVTTVFFEYRLRLVIFFRSDFAAYIRKKTVSYGFEAIIEIFGPNAASNRG